MKKVTIEGKVLVFHTLAISKIAHPSIITTVPHLIINQLNNIQKSFIWDTKIPKIKHSTLSNSYKDSGCKNFKFHQCLEPSIRSQKNLPNFYKKMITNCAKCLSCSVTYHQRFFSSFYILAQILNLPIRAFLSLALRVKRSLLPATFFTKMARLNHEIILNQNVTLKASWNTVSFN